MSQENNRCVHRNYINPHPETIRIGGVCVGQCENEVLPGMTVCYLHADREAMAFHIRNLAEKLKKLGVKI